MNRIIIIAIVVIVASLLYWYFAQSSADSIVHSDDVVVAVSESEAGDRPHVPAQEDVIVLSEEDLIAQKQETVPFTPPAPAIDYAPDFSLAYIDRPAEIFTLSEFRGEKPVIVDFFAEHCPNCRHNLPKMEALQAVYGDQVEVILIGIDSQSATERYLRNHPTTLPLVMQDNRVARNYGLRFTNTKALINRDGSLRAVLHGRDITEQHFIDLIES